jgi:hypothetical protein
MARSPTPAILVTGAGIPVNARTPVVPDPVDDVAPLKPDVDPGSTPEPVEPVPLEADALGEALAAVVVVALPAVVEVELPDVVEVDVPVVVDVVVVGGRVVDVVPPDVPGAPGTADQTKPLGSLLFAVNVISTFQLSVSTPAPVTQATPASQTPPVPPRTVATSPSALRPGPHSRSLGSVGTKLLDATLKLVTGPPASMKA